MYGQVITDEYCPTVALLWARKDEAAKKSDIRSESSATTRVLVHIKADEP